MKRILQVGIAAVVLSFYLFASANAGEFSWQGGQGGSAAAKAWDNAGNWILLSGPAGLGYPAASDTARIGDRISAASSGPTLRADAACKLLEIADLKPGVLTLSGHALTVGVGGIFGGGTLDASGTSTVVDAGPFTIANFIPGSSTVTLTGATTLGPYTFNNLTTSATTLTGSVTVNGTLTLNGKVTLGSNNLTIGSAGSISGVSTTNYVVTNSTGVLTRNVAAAGSAGSEFPIGNTTFNRATVTITSGKADNFSARVQDSFDGGNPPNAGGRIDRQWTITEANTGRTATLKLEWGSGAVSGFNRGAGIFIGRWNGAQWLQTAATLDSSIISGQKIFSATATGFTTFSPFGVANNGALPIQLASSSASVIRDNDVEVSWRTVSETNNYGFEIYRKRAEAGEWTKVAFVEGHGTTLEAQSYAFVDRGLSFGKYYYQIKQIDLDGKSEYFPEMEVNVGVGPDKFVLAQNYPNPFNPSTLIDFVVPQSGFATMKVYNVLGQEVASLFEGNVEGGKIYTARFDASNLPSGLYFYTLRSNGKSDTKRMVLMK
jgi:hypothetical protein